MKKLIAIFILILSCASNCLAQDSFRNPFRFEYVVEYTSTSTDSLLYQTDNGRLKMTYNAENQTSNYKIQLNDSLIVEGRVLDKRLEQNQQQYLLEKFFENKYNAYLVIARSQEYLNEKVAFIYYSNQKEDAAPEKTCIYLMLSDYTPEDKNAR